VISRGLITQRANDEQLPAQTIERDYVLANVCADIGDLANARLVFKGGTLLRLCYFDDYRYSADLDFSAIDGLTTGDAGVVVGTAVDACRTRIEAPMLEVSATDGGTMWISYIGPLGSKPRRIKLDISDDELVEGHHRLPILARWSDLPEDGAIEGYALDEVGAEKLRCIAERLQCRDLFDLHELLDGQHVDAMEAWHLYLRKAANDATRDRQRTPPRQWAATFERRLPAYRDRWDHELGDYLSSIPSFGDIERRTRRRLGLVIAAAQTLMG
jgi:predicted nucleotidyltransferase component of viral defense system